ncbi:MAG: hypothetical protein ABFD86_03215 [Bryobacteraceae bacterium]
MLAEIGDNLDEATEMIQRALKKVPPDPKFLHTMRLIHAQKGSHGAAISIH